MEVEAYRPPHHRRARRRLVRLGDTAMLALIKLEVMSPPAETPDEGSVAVEFHMPPICSPLVRPGRPAEAAPVISKALEDVLMRLRNVSLINLDDGSQKFSMGIMPDLHVAYLLGHIIEEVEALSLADLVSRCNYWALAANGGGRKVKHQGCGHGVAQRDLKREENDTFLCFNALKSLPGSNNLLKAYENKSAFAMCIFSLALGPEEEPITFVGKTTVLVDEHECSSGGGGAMWLNAGGRSKDGDFNTTHPGDSRLSPHLISVHACFSFQGIFRL